MHVGELIEELIRVNQLSISEVARKMHVNRRSVYNWFKQKSIRPYILHRICTVLAYDFSIELPKVIKEEQTKMGNSEDMVVPDKAVESKTVSYWKNKYIYLLEKYNEVLSHDPPKGDHPPRKSY